MFLFPPVWHIQLYNQLSGRAGRFSKNSTIIYQTIMPLNETLRDVLSGSSKIMIDQNSGNGVVPYLPLNELNKNKQGSNN